MSQQALAMHLVAVCCAVGPSQICENRCRTFEIAKQSCLSGKKSIDSVLFCAMAVNDSSGKNLRRVTARFEGRVQGVGFRFTTVAVAAKFDVTGYVRNEFDGSVSVVAEGQEETLRGFLRAVRRSPIGRYIVKEDITWGAPSHEFRTFGVGY